MSFIFQDLGPGAAPCTPVTTGAGSDSWWHSTENSAPPFSLLLCSFTALGSPFLSHLAIITDLLPRFVLTLKSMCVPLWQGY